MRVAHYHTAIELAQGGIVRYVLDLARVQRREGDDALILALRAPDRGEDPAIELGPASGLLNTLPRDALRRASDAIAGGDVLHLHGLWDPVMVQLAGAARRAGVPYVLTVHGMLNDWCMAQRGAKKRAYLALVGRRLAEGARTVICSSDEELAQARRWLGRSRAVVVPPVTDLEPYLRPVARAGTGEDAWKGAEGEGERPIVLFLLRLHPKKGVELLLDALRVLKARGVRARFIIAGTGEAAYERQLRELAAARGVGDAVEFVGGVYGEAKRSLYAASAMLVLPSEQENFGLVLIEAMVCGTPVITTRGVDIWREIEESGGGLIVEREVNALSDAIASLLADRDRRVAMGERARAWVHARFDAPAGAARFRSLYSPDLC